MLKKCFLSFIVILPLTGWTCTDFLLSSQDNMKVVGRSMEFGIVLPIELQVVTKGIKTTSKLQNSPDGISWTNKYAYVGMVHKPSQAVVDGFNENGLSLGLLWMPGSQYPAPTSNAPGSALYLADMSRWILSNFGNVKEVKEALPKMNLVSTSVPGFQELPPTHISLHDASGNSAVVEFIDGEIKIYDNPIGVLTNAPEFPWHITNLRNFINLSDINAKRVSINGTVLDPTGEGTGLLGIPGDWTPPSRFVRMVIFKQSLAPLIDVKDAVIAAIHLLNTVDIPYGAVRASKKEDFDYTQWIVIKDLTNKQLYYRTYSDQNIQTFDFANNLTQSSNMDLEKVSP